MNHQGYTEKLVSGIPELIPLFKEHKADYGELLPHVFFGDLARYFTSLYRKSLQGNKSAEESLAKILLALEKGMASEVKDVQELIAVSFLENVDWEDPGFQKLKNMLGPRLSEELNNLGEGRS